MDKIDITIIGGGVIGLAIAAYVADKDKDIFVFEKNISFGQETSSRNSEVIHSGIYYPENSLKAVSCVEGNHMLYEIACSNNIPHNKLGKLIVARNESEIETLEELFESGRKNGVEGLKMLSGDKIKQYEENVTAVQAIFLPTTGIIDSHSLMEYFLMTAKENGADVLYNSEVIAINKMSSGYTVTINETGGEEYKFISDIIINCAGLNSDEIAKMSNFSGEKYDLWYCKGDYFRVTDRKKKMIKHLVYPVSKPDDASLGIHVTPDLSGGIRLGPDAEYMNSREIDYAVSSGKRELFYENAKTFLPLLEEEDLAADTSGIRPKLQGPEDGFRDFIISNEPDPCFINLIGIESPGLTASPSIARRVKQMVELLK